MADFEQVIDRLIRAEGGYQVTNIKNDRGGMTCAGISRRANSDWPGWKFIDKGIAPDDYRVKPLIHALYEHRYWDAIKGDQIYNVDLAYLVFSCAVLSGARTSSRHAQRACGATVDGFIGSHTLAKLNSTEVELFALRFTLSRIARHVAIADHDGTQRDFLLGWVKRDLGEKP